MLCADVPPAVGVDVRLQGEKVHGAALVRGGQLVHLELFRAA